MQGKIHFKNLDSLRCLAAFMVVSVHVYEAWISYVGYPSSFLLDADHKPIGIAKYIDVLIKNGVFGVDIFFLISGFLICYLLLCEKEKNNTISIKNFFIRRSLRIWPVYFFVIGISPLIVAWLNKPPPDYLSNLFFLNNYHAISIKSWAFPLGHLWSICVEEHFYLLCPFLILLVPKNKLLPVFLFLILVSIIYRGYTYHTHDNWYFKIYLNTVSRFDALIIGCIAALIHFNSPIKIKHSLITRLIILIILVLSLVIDYQFNWDDLFLSCFKKYIYLLLVGYLMLNFVFNEKPFFNDIKWMNYLGKISYGIYMYSNIIVTIVAEKIVPELGNVSIFTFIAINLSMTIVISALSYEIFEKFFIKQKAKFEVIKTEADRV